MQAIRAKYAKLPCKILKITEPLEIADIRYYKDGGSIGLVLKDADKNDHKFCWDGRKPGPFPLLVGAIYPTDGGGKELTVRGPEESELYAVMLRWANKRPQREALFDSKKQIDHRHDPHLWEVRTFFLRLDRDFTGSAQAK